MKTLTNPMPWLLRRELWEHKGGFVWTPAAIAGAMVLLFVFGLFAALGQSGGEVNGVAIGELATQHADKVDEATHMLAQSYLLAGAPLFIALGMVVFFFSLGTLFDERKDRSIMFWKSLPVSDGATVTSKAIMALVVAPLITTVLAVATGILVLLGICLGGLTQGVNLFGAFADAEFYLSIGRGLAVLPVYALWALPTVGWLMLVGVSARSKPFLWAILLPVAFAMILQMVGKSFGIDMGWAGHVAQQVLLSTIPGTWLIEADHASKIVPMQAIFDGSMAALGQARLWGGAVAGVGMLALAARVRRGQDDS